MFRRDKSHLKSGTFYIFYIYIKTEKLSKSSPFIIQEGKRLLGCFYSPLYMCDASIVTVKWLLLSLTIFFFSKIKIYIYYLYMYVTKCCIKIIVRLYSCYHSDLFIIIRRRILFLLLLERIFFAFSYFLFVYTNKKNMEMQNNIHFIINMYYYYIILYCV